MNNIEKLNASLLDIVMCCMLIFILVVMASVVLIGLYWLIVELRDYLTNKI